MAQDPAGLSASAWRAIWARYNRTVQGLEVVRVDASVSCS